MTGFLRGKALWARQAGFAAGFAAALERCQPAKAANKAKQRGVAEKMDLPPGILGRQIIWPHIVFGRVIWAAGRARGRLFSFQPLATLPDELR